MKKIRMKQKIGLIGVGNMGTAILEGLFAKGIAKPTQVWVYDKMTSKAGGFSRKWKAHLAGSSEKVIKSADIILLAVKPQDLNSAVSSLRPIFRKTQVLVSILAGTPMSKIKKAVGSRPGVVRAMPNLGAKVGQGITALAASGSGGKNLAAAEKLFSGCGRTVKLQEKYFDLVTAVSGSGPAYFFLMMEMLTNESTSKGIPEPKARLLAVQTAVGAALLAQASPMSPEALRKMVTSKGGTTEAALKLLKSKNFSKTFHQALRAAVKRGQQLSR